MATAKELEALKAELKEELKAEMQEEQAKAEEEKAEALKPDPYWEEYVTVTLFKDGRDYKDDVFVAVNGETCQIQRGKPVQIKRKFLQAIEDSQNQDIYAAEKETELQNEYQQMAVKIEK